jgi:cytochrome c-type biogenesis protein CcmE
MSITVTGTIQRSDIGPGTWTLLTDSGETYEIRKGAPKDLLQKGQKVKVTGQVREDVMTASMIGPVLEVKSFEVVKSD